MKLITSMMCSGEKKNKQKSQIVMSKYTSGLRKVFPMLLQQTN